jgi:hypothetical protein
MTSLTFSSGMAGYQLMVLGIITFLPLGMLQGVGVVALGFI